MTRHNEVRDILSDSLRDVCSEVTVEPSLVPVTGEQFELRSASTESEARLDIAASGFFGGRFERAFFDVRVFSPFARSNQGTLNAVYRRQEQEKRRKYGQRVRELEHASFVPLVFTCTGGAGPAATTFLKRLADRISSTHQLSYNEAIVWLRTRLSFALLRSSLMCIRGSRPHRSRRVDLNAVPVAISETKIWVF